MSRKTVIAFGVSIFTAFFAPSGPALAQSELSWTYSRAVSTDVEATDLLIAYGVPFSGFLLARFDCDRNGGAPFVHANFVTEIGAATERSPANLFVQPHGGAALSVSGLVYTDPYDFGAVGMTAELPLTHPFFSALRQYDSLSYHLPGLPGNTLPLAQARGDISQFLQDCANIDQLDARTSPASGHPEPQDPAGNCARFTNMRSRTETFPLEITFSNQTSEDRVLFWIDHDGLPHQLAYLATGQEATTATYVTHPMMITNASGQCLAVVEPQVGQSRHEIRN